MHSATPRPSAPPPSSYALRARARRIEAERVADRAARSQAGVCDCGLPATVGEHCAACHKAHKAAVASAFGGL